MRSPDLQPITRVGVARTLIAHPRKNFGDFYRVYYPRVLNYFAFHTRDAQLSLELTAETFAKVFEDREKFRGTTSKEAVGWLWVIARKELNLYWRRKQVETSALQRLGIRAPHATDDEAQEILERAALEPQHQVLHDAFQTLTDLQREVIEMSVLQERSDEEIALALGVSQTTVRKRRSKGLRKLARNAAVRRARRASQ